MTLRGPPGHYPIMFRFLFFEYAMVQLECGGIGCTTWLGVFLCFKYICFYSKVATAISRQMMTRMESKPFHVGISFIKTYAIYQEYYNQIESPKPWGVVSRISRCMLLLQKHGRISSHRCISRNRLANIRESNTDVLCYIV